MSLAFGAFVAGMVIGESDYSHQALNDIIPLRDIFGLVFFTSIGMLLNPLFLYNNLLLILLLVVLVVAGKFIVFSLLSMTFRYFNIIPLALGFGLAQIGEFSFVLARTGLKNNIITQDFYSLALSVSVITMIMSPFLSMIPAKLYSLKKKYSKHEDIQTVNLPKGGLRNHIVIAGGGRVGSQIASVFSKAELPFIILEQDFRRFEKVKDAGFPVIYGDAGQESVLAASKTGSAKLIIIAIPLIDTAREIISITFKTNPAAKIIARADDISQVDELFRMNIFEVVQPEFEASLEIIRKSLMLLDVPLTTIYGFTDDIRRQNCSTFRIENIQHSLSANIRKTPFLLEMSWVEVLKESKISGKSPGEMAIRTRTGVSVVGVLRKNEFIPNPDADFIFQPDDYIAIIGTPENKKLFDEIMISIAEKLQTGTEAGK